MRGRRILIAIIALAAADSALLIGLLWDDLTFTPGVTPSNFARLHKGMSEEEVEQILGGPGEFRYYMTMSITQGWSGPDCEVEVTFVFGASWGVLRRPDGPSMQLAEKPEPPFAPLRQWLRTLGW